VLADGYAEVAVERLEDDVDRLCSRRTRFGLLGHLGEVGDQERPPDQAEELTTDASTPKTSPRTTTVGSASSNAIAIRTASAENSTAESANTHQIRIRPVPPAKALQDLVSRAPQDVRIVEPLRQKREADVEEDRGCDQDDPCYCLLAHAPRPRRDSQAISAPSTSPISGAKGRSVVTLTTMPSANPTTAPRAIRTPSLIPLTGAA
jgi:hypothetical protein